MLTAEDYIRLLELEAHPEGGWFRETYRSDETIAPEELPARFDACRCFATSIYFLITSDNFSALHRIAADEQWHFYAGSPLTVHVIEQSGLYLTLRLGSDPQRGEQFQAVVPHGCWFGATVEEPGGFALVGCSVAPGFEFDDFELGRRSSLIAAFPQHRTLIERLTRG